MIGSLISFAYYVRKSLELPLASTLNKFFRVQNNKKKVTPFNLIYLKESIACLKLVERSENLKKERKIPNSNSTFLQIYPQLYLKFPFFSLSFPKFQMPQESEVR